MSPGICWFFLPNCSVVQAVKLGYSGGVEVIS